VTLDIVKNMSKTYQKKNKNMSKVWTVTVQKQDSNTWTVTIQMIVDEQF